MKNARRRRVAPANNTHERDTLPPHSEELERAALGCVLLAGAAGSQAEADALLEQLRPSLFYDQRYARLLAAMVHLRMEAHAVDSVTVFEKLKADGEKDVTVKDLLDVSEQAATVLNFPTYLADLRKLALRRWTLQKSGTMTALATADDLSVEQLQNEFAELYDKSQRIGHTARQRLKVWKMAELQQYKPDPRNALVGHNEIKRGYEGVCVVAGPGSSGKSLCVVSLAAAGAIGTGLWMGRKVHRRFRTLIIQAENGTERLKLEAETWCRNHPQRAKAFAESVFFTDPPEGGLPFHHHDFRAAVRRAIEELKPDLVVIDPWSQVASEDAAKEVVDKLNEIRSCFPVGDDCPGLLIIAHTKKPRAEDVRKGRGLTYLVSGSIALPNTARCVYVLLPWCDDMTDDRIYWACPKLNDGEMYAPTVWRRRFGNFFEHDGNTDPTTWGTVEQDDRRAITEDEVRECFEGKQDLSKGAIVKALRAKFQHPDSTSYRALDEDGYLREYLMRSGNGKLKLKNP